MHIEVAARDVSSGGAGPGHVTCRVDTDRQVASGVHVVMSVAMGRYEVVRVDHVDDAGLVLVDGGRCGRCELVGVVTGTVRILQTRL